MVQFSDEQDLKHGVTEDWLEKLVNQCLLYENINYSCEVGVTFVEDETIRNLNREHRNIDRKTDVLSFPMLSDVHNIEKTDIDPETGLVYLGDIVISVETAMQQADEFGHSLEREIAFLIVHSMMHLMGYDHIDEIDRKVMREHEEAVLDELNIKRTEIN